MPRKEEPKINTGGDMLIRAIPSDVVAIISHMKASMLLNNPGKPVVSNADAFFKICREYDKLTKPKQAQ